MRYLDANELIYMNAQVGMGITRDREALDRAVQRPNEEIFGAELYPTIDAKSAALTESLIQERPFIRGNKRTAVLATVAFYGLNGYEFVAPQDEMLRFVLAVAARELNVEEMTRQLGRWAFELPDQR